MKPQLILQLEKELNCSFKSVELNKIEGYKSEKTFEYSVDDTGNITGIAIRNDLKKIPQTLTKFKTLSKLNLSDNKISDISPLTALTNIQKLDLHTNQISDISPLAALTNIQELLLHYNQISDIFPLAALINIQTLVLEGNQISDISPLAALTNI